MKIRVDYEEDQAEKVKISFSEAGRRGGKARVAKGFSMASEEKRREMGRLGAMKRWRCVK